MIRRFLTSSRTTDLPRFSEVLAPVTQYPADSLMSLMMIDDAKVFIGDFMGLEIVNRDDDLCRWIQVS